MNKATDDDVLQATLAAVETAKGNKAEAARILGIPVSTVKARLQAAVRRNLTGTTTLAPIPDGYSTGRITRLVSPDGVSMQWEHLLPDGQDPEIVADIIATALNAVKPVAPITLVNHLHFGALATIYPLADLHLGMLSWAKETGDNYDSDIAVDLAKRAITTLVELSPASETAVILDLGDFFHADNNRAETEKSHNHLDVDSRYDRILHLGCELLCWTIETALQKHKRVIVKCMRGNHDPYASKALTLGLYMRYQNNPRVTVDRVPADVWFWQFGKNMVAAHHGDKIKPEDMPGVMAAFEPKMWGETEYRFAYLGHLHRVMKHTSDEKHGAMWEVFGTLAGKDEWNKSMGHASKRTMTSITLQEDGGEFSRNTFNVKGA